MDRLGQISAPVPYVSARGRAASGGGERCHDRYPLSTTRMQSYRGSGERASVSFGRANRANKVDYEIIGD
jgi:hypothetical protein